jgi:hypothetical protein
VINQITTNNAKPIPNPPGRERISPTTSAQRIVYATARVYHSGISQTQASCWQQRQPAPELTDSHVTPNQEMKKRQREIRSAKTN